MEESKRRKRQELRRHLPWLYKELPELTAQGVVDGETAQRLRSHYGQPEPMMSRATLLMVLVSILGAVLAGGGVIMLIAHNWDELPRNIKLALAFLPLVVSLVLGIFTLAKEKSQAWTESVPVFIALSVAASISLVAQTYHISGDLPQFLLTWAILTLPLLYLFRSTATALLYLVLICSWTGAACGNGRETWLFWVLLAGYVPFLARQWDADRDSGSVIWQKWALGGIGLFIPGFLSAQAYRPFDWKLDYLLTLIVFYLLALSGREDEEESFWRRPLANLGLLGMGIVSASLCFKFNWQSNPARDLAAFTVSPFANTAFFGLLAVVWLGLVYELLAGKKYFPLLWAVLPLFPPALWLLQHYGLSGNAAATVFSAYLFLAGLAALFIGYRTDRWLRMNGGVAVAMFPVLVKFFDSSFTFIHKGVVFISLGIILLALNLTFAKRRAAAATSAARKEGAA